MFTFASKKSSKGMMNEEKQIIAGSPMAWLLAARPKTLAGGIQACPRYTLCTVRFHNAD